MPSLHVVTYCLLPSTINNTRPSAIYQIISDKLVEPMKIVFSVKVALHIKPIKEFISFRTHPFNTKKNKNTHDRHLG